MPVPDQPAAFPQISPAYRQSLLWISQTREHSHRQVYWNVQINVLADVRSEHVLIIVVCVTFVDIWLNVVGRLPARRSHWRFAA